MISPDCKIKPASRPEGGERLCWEPECRKALPKYARKWCGDHGGRFQIWLRNHKWWVARDFALLAACVSAHPKGKAAIRKYGERNDGFGAHRSWHDPCQYPCAICHEITESPEVDHKIPMSGDDRADEDCRHHESHLRVLCSDCHKEVTAVQAGARAAAKRGNPQMELIPK